MNLKLLFNMLFKNLMPFFLAIFSLNGFSQGTLEVIGNNNLIVRGSTTPSLNNLTDFGDVAIGDSQANAFFLDNIENGGNPSKRLNDIVVTVSGSSDFSPSSSNLGSLKGSDNPISHLVTFAPSSSGIKTATVTINFSNGTNAPYSFAISGNGVAPSPEIQITDSGSSVINSGGSFNFGTNPPNSSTNEIFTIENIANSSTILNLTGTPIVAISGDSEFAVTTQPIGNSILGGNSQTFVVTYSPLTTGSHFATLSIANDDPDGNENPYLISLQGTANTVSYTPTTSGPDWTVTNITADNELNYPNTIIYGPDNQLWITERVGKKVVKVDPILGGSKSVMLDLSAVVYQTAGQDGLMGMAVHPALYADINTATNNYVYLAYTYNSGGRKLRIASYTYNSATGTLNAASATTILEGFDASNDHNSGKLQIGPDMKLYYTAGDQGYNQFSNACLEIQSQVLPTSGGQTALTGDKSAYKGKILRIELDGTVPTDNPLLGGFRTHVYTYGHRNPQGLVFGSDGTLYSSEHGPKVDDELNIIHAGKNYGWPNIAGYYDGLAYAYCNWSSSPTCNAGSFSDHNCPSDVTPIPEFDAVNNAILPDFQPPIGTYNSTVNTDPSGGYLTWPTVAPAGLTIYESDAIPGWNKSLLIPTLKRGTIFRAKLNATGDALESQTYEEFHSSNDRYRDVAVDPNGVTFYAITDNTGGTSGPSGTSSVSIENPGVIVKIQYKCIVGGPCNDGNACTINDVYDSDCNCLGTIADVDGDGVCDAEDVCPEWDDNLLGQPCNDGDICTTNDVYVSCNTCVGTYEDKDGDGYCVGNDPDDNDGCNPDSNSPTCSTCVISSGSFTPNPLIHSGSGSNSATLSLGNSQDASFTITGLDQLTGGKPTNRFIEVVTVTYNNGSGNQILGTYSAADMSSVNVSISGPVTSITVALSDGYNGNTSTTLSVNLGTVNYCNNGGASGSRAFGSSKESAKYSDGTIKIYPNPASTELIVEIMESNVNVNVSMYAITGQLIKHLDMKSNREVIDVDRLPSGLYLLRLTDTNGEVLKTDRIVIE